MDMPAAIELTAAQARVLGAMLEKQLTTPDAYPLTLKALTTACNQTSNRDPIVDYQPREVETTVLALKAKGLARVVHPGSGERATKFRQVLDEALHLTGADRSLLCVLFLRGPQTASELRTRTERLHPFSSPGAIEEALDALAERDPPLVARVDRLPGQKEGRWIQLLEVGAEARAAATTSTTVTPTSQAGG
ncbi:MAG: YceH family protein, partial [Acidimicrobiia bacterium]|nr:YceH family protein [Acidimicrobiia bacterium]